ncbi:hypothetical protein HPB48_026252 [Haemaphysalis longicornis]|uniref:Uncharacterized protein n=1 Tax=Haemaphysalis longicornis TaxID=44386 RepID=A0A9J6H967_HAELO|nr:hypothetical protein HPB48_026252 [Haemaphysalis longicornis]
MSAPPALLRPPVLDLQPASLQPPASTTPVITTLPPFTTAAPPPTHNVTVPRSPAPAPYDHSARASSRTDFSQGDHDDEEIYDAEMSAANESLPPRHTEEGDDDDGDEGWIRGGNFKATTSAATPMTASTRASGTMENRRVQLHPPTEVTWAAMTSGAGTMGKPTRDGNNGLGRDSALERELQSVRRENAILRAQMERQEDTMAELCRKLEKVFEKWQPSSSPETSTPTPSPGRTTPPTAARSPVRIPLEPVEDAQDDDPSANEGANVEAMHDDMETENEPVKRRRALKSKARDDARQQYVTREELQSYQDATNRQFETLNTRLSAVEAAQAEMLSSFKARSDKIENMLAALCKKLTSPSHSTTPSPRPLLTETQAVGYHLVNDVSIPTRHAPTSVHRGTNPDLAFSNNTKVKWRNTTETLGSGHCLLELTVPLKEDEGVEEQEPAPITTYGGVLEWHREQRKRYPAPHPDLSRREVALIPQLQVGATWTPVWAVHVTPERFITDQCAVCGAARATMTHMMWECNDAEAETNILPPHLARAVRETDKDAQKAAAQFALAAITRQQSRPAPPS